MYGVNISNKNIFKLIQHIIQHSQQQKAKINSLEKFTDKTGLLAGDYFQKVLPMAFWEGQYSYFGTEGMTLHSDVLLLKVNNQIQKHTYFTTAYRSDHWTADFLTIVDYAIKQVARDLWYYRALL